MQPTEDSRPMTALRILIDYQMAADDYRRARARWSAAMDALEAREMELVHLLRTNGLRDIAFDDTLFELTYHDTDGPRIGTHPLATPFTDGLTVPDAFPRPLTLAPTDIERELNIRIDVA